MLRMSQDINQKRIQLALAWGWEHRNPRQQVVRSIEPLLTAVLTKQRGRLTSMIGRESLLVTPSLLQLAME